MNRIAKRVAAVTVAATLGVAALGFNPAQATGASWRETQTAEIGVINTGILALSHQELSWTNANTGEVINDVTQVELAPGVVITGRASVTPELIGQDLTAELNARWAGVNISETAQQLIQLSAHLELIDGNIPVNPNVSIGRATEDNGVEIPLVITFAIKGDANIPGMFSETLDLGELTISLAQTGPGGWRSDNVTFDLPPLTLAGDQEPETVTPLVCPPWEFRQDGGGYLRGDCRTHEIEGRGIRTWEAAWDASGTEVPGGHPHPNGAWMEFGDPVPGPNGTMVRTWTDSWIYPVGTVVSHEGHFFRFNGQGNNRNNPPSQDNPAWTLAR